MGIFMQSGGQQNVIRYNEFYSKISENPTGANDRHWMQDGMMGDPNMGATGFPGADSDVYHNLVRNVMDDGIETEGGGRNVRVWGNYGDYAGGSGIASTVAHFGPIYIFRNVINRIRKYHVNTVNPDGTNNNVQEPDDDHWERGIGFKAYGLDQDDNGVWWGGGRQYFFNNTFLQQPKATYVPPHWADQHAGAQSWADLGAMDTISGKDSGSGLRQTWSRNNILHTMRSDSWSIRIGSGGANNDFANDLYNGGGASGGTSGTPTYKSGNGWNAGPSFTYEGGTNVGTGWFQLDSGSSGKSGGQPLPNFTKDIENVELARKSGVEVVGGNPDVGAHQSDSANSMVFGLKAAQPQ
jgi:hypothetical protein